MSSSLIPKQMCPLLLYYSNLSPETDSIKGNSLENVHMNFTLISLNCHFHVNFTLYFFM